MKAPLVIVVSNSRHAQCARAANYLEVHPGCGLRELADGADLGSASKVIAEMARFGYGIRRQWVQVPCPESTHFRREQRYWLESAPPSMPTDSQPQSLLARILSRIAAVLRDKHG